MHYHLIGIAGTAMGSLAGLLRAKGHRVTGSDEGVYPPMSTLLDDLGIEYQRGFSPGNLEPPPDMVVVGNAISRGNEELEAVLDHRVPYTSAAAVIEAEFLRGRHVVAVAGTHGKTTTTSLLAWLLECGGREPSFLIGGVAENFGTSFRLTASDHFVIEADEYDTAYFDKGPKMWHYLPRTAVLTNVEFDHADIFRDEQAYRFAFERFVNLVPRSGALIAGWESRTVRELSRGSFAPVEGFAVADDGPSGGEPASAEARMRDHAIPDASEGTPLAPQPVWLATDVAFEPGGTRFTVTRGGEPLGEVRTPLLGAFNVQNALAAIAAATAVGVGWDAIAAGLASFRSVKRRMELRGTVGGVEIVDDFAHHPTAVRGTVAAVRARVRDGGRVIAIFEPRSYTAQRREFQEAFRDALSGADRVILAGLHHPERYDRETGMDPEELVAALRAGGVPADYEPEVEAIVRLVASEAASGDVVLVMSNGGFEGIHEKLLRAVDPRAPGPVNP